MSEEVHFTDSPAAALEAAPQGEAAVAPSKEVAVKVVLPRRARANARWVSYLVLACIVFLVVPMYFYKHQEGIRNAAHDPISILIPFGGGVDTHELIRRLNPDGQQIYMADVNSGAVALRKGNQTMVTFKTEEGTEREAVLYVPESYNSTSGASVAMMVLFHGLNDNCKNFLDATGFVPYADRDGFVIASVCGSLGYLGTAWNSGTCCGFSGDKPNDIGLANQVVREVSKSYAIDENRVMAVGFSNGAMLAEVLACESSDVFRAVASIGGIVELRPGNADGLAKCTAAVRNSGTTSRTSVLMVHGTADVMVPWGGNRLLGFPPVTDNVEGWKERNGCTGEPTTSISTPTYTNTLYDNCSGRRNWVPQVMVCPKEGTEVAGYTPAPENSSSPMNGPSPNAPGTATEELRIRDEARRQVVVQSIRQALVKELKVDNEDDTRDGDEHKRRHRGRKHKREGKHKRHDTDDDDDVEEGAREVEEEDGHADDGHHHGKKARKHHGYGHKHGDKHGAKQGHKHGDKGEHKYGAHPHDHEHKHRGHKHTSPRSPAPKQTLVAPITGDVILRDWDGLSQVELVRVKDGSHSWPQDKEFSTTDYIYAFGGRVFGRYN